MRMSYWRNVTKYLIKIWLVSDVLLLGFPGNRHITKTIWNTFDKRGDCHSCSVLLHFDLIAFHLSSPTSLLIWIHEAFRGGGVLRDLQNKMYSHSDFLKWEGHDMGIIRNPIYLDVYMVFTGTYISQWSYINISLKNGYICRTLIFLLLLSFIFSFLIFFFSLFYHPGI